MENNNILLSQEFSVYNRAMAEVNVFGSTLDNLNNGDYAITVTTKTWYKEQRARFPAVPQLIETEEITARQYACYISSIGFFKDEVGMGRTPVGTIPTRLTCYSPDRRIKVERTFTVFELVDEMTLKLTDDQIWK